MILSGEKKEEYREIKPFWENVFIKTGSSIHIKIKGKIYDPSNITICFSNGYSKSRDQFFIKCIGCSEGYGQEKWGAELSKKYFVLKLGEILHTL